LKAQVSLNEIRKPTKEKLDTLGSPYKEYDDQLSRLGRYSSAVTLVRGGINPERIFTSTSNHELSLLYPSSISNVSINRKKNLGKIIKNEKFYSDDLLLQADD